MMQHLTDYTSMEHATDPLRYQLEYVIGGKNTDQENLKAVVYRLLAAREAANMMYLLQDPTRQAEIHEMALVICAAIGFPALEGIVSLALQAAWAFGESLLDVRQLLTGGKVPLVKTGDTWMVSLHQLAKITELLKNSRAVEQRHDISGISWDFTDDRIPLRELYRKYQHTGRVVMVEDHNCMELKGLFLNAASSLVPEPTRPSLHILPAFRHWWWATPSKRAALLGICSARRRATFCRCSSSGRAMN